MLTTRCAVHLWACLCSSLLYGSFNIMHQLGGRQIFMLVARATCMMTCLHDLFATANQAEERKVRAAIAWQTGTSNVHFSGTVNRS